MGQDSERFHGSAGDVVKSVAAVLLIGAVLAAGERSLAPLAMQGPDDRTPADVSATEAVHRHVASYASEPNAGDRVNTFQEHR